MTNGKIKNWFLSYRVGYKVLAFLLALLLWYFVTGQRDPLVERTLSRPLEPRGLSSQLVLASPLPEVKVTVRGAKSAIQGLGPEKVRVFVDLAGQSAGETLLPVKTEVPFGAVVTGLEPGRVRVQLDFWGEKEVPVRVTVLGEPAGGYTLLTPVATPSQVLVRGPSSYLAQVHEVQSVLRIRDARQNVTQKVPVQIPQELREELKVRPEVVEVLVPVTTRGPVKPVSVVAVLQGEPKRGFVVKGSLVEPTQIRITGPSDTLAGLTGIRTQPVNISGAEATLVQETGLSLPEGVFPVDQNKVKVTVEVIRSDTEQLPEE
ncbi:MAG: CdaR family protein [Bacillota bacterium]|jgi:YbbR domain-containing protein|nr:CdaR family protein [Bacillota bacterium]